jgi:hypothetical protein
MSRRRRSLNATKISFFAFQDIITAVSGILILVTLILATDLDRPSSRTTQDADPELERKLSETLRQQAEVDTKNRNLQELLAAAETAPAAEKLETDITRVRAQLAEERRQLAGVAEQLAASQSTLEARDRTLGLTDLKAQIQRVIQEAEALAREETKVRDEMARLDQRVTGVQSKLLKLREREGKLWLIPDKTSTTKEPILAVISAAGAKLERFDQPDQTKEFSKSNARAGFDSYLRKWNTNDQYVVFLIRPSGIALFDSLVKMARAQGFEVGFDALEEDKEVYFSTPPIPDETTPPPRQPVSQGPPGGGGFSDPKGRSTGPGTSGEVGANNSGAGAKQGQAPEASGSSGVDGPSSASKQPGAAGSSAAARPTSAAAARERNWWQRLLGWFGFSGSQGGAAQTGGAGGRGGGSGPGSGTGAGGGNGAGSGTGNNTSPDTGTGAGSGGGSAGSSGGGKTNGLGVGDRRGASSGTGVTNGTGPATAKSADASERSADTNSPAFTDPKKPTPPPAAQPTPPTPLRPKGWWQRFLEWIGLRKS